jgi:hypothetical protein
LSRLLSDVWPKKGFPGRWANGGILIGQTYFPKTSPSPSCPNTAKRGLPFKGRNGGILADPLVKRNKGRNMGASFKKVKDYVIIKIGDGRTG